MKPTPRLCQCGCGGETTLDRRDVPHRFIRGHNRTNTGLGWKEQGCWYLRVAGKKKALHRFIMETVLGRELRPDEIVHHADHNPLNNDPANLVVVSRAEHMRIHSRAGRPPRWTDQEKGRLLELRQAGMTIQDCSAVLQRPYFGTRVQAAKLGRPTESVPTAREDAIPQAA